MNSRVGAEGLGFSLAVALTERRIPNAVASGGGDAGVGGAVSAPAVDCRAPDIPVVPEDDHSGSVSLGIAKSELKTNVVLPPLAGLMVPERSLIAKGSPSWLVRM